MMSKNDDIDDDIDDDDNDNISYLNLPKFK